MVCMKVIKKNQIFMFVMALMLITVGYMNYIKHGYKSLETAGMIDSEEIAGIGDAQLVNSNNINSENIQKNEIDNSKQTDKTTISNTNNTNEKNNNEKISTDNAVSTNNEIISTNSETRDYFESSRLDREKMYSQMLATYQKILENSSISEPQKTISQSEITKIQNIKNRIMIAENLIKNKGFRDVIIFVNDSSISVILDSEKLGEAEIAQIQNIIVRELNVKIENIHVSKK